MFSEEPRIKICDACQSREPAYLRVTYTRLGPEISSKMEQFCATCFAGAAREEELFAIKFIRDALLHGRCKHCGASPRHVVGHVVFMEGTAPRWLVECEQLRCERCDALFLEFLATPEGRLDLSGSLWRVGERAAEFESRADRFIQQRRSDKDGLKLQHQIRLSRSSYQFRFFRASGSGMLLSVGAPEPM